MSDNNDFWKGLCEHYGYPYFEEPEDPFLDDLINIFDHFAKYGKYHMTYNDMKPHIGTSYFSLTKKIPRYVESEDILRYGSKDNAEFVLPKYEQQYWSQKQKLDIEQLKPIAYFESVINLNIYMEKLQLMLNPSNTYGKSLFERWRDTFSSSNPIAITWRKKNNKSFYYYFKFLFYKSGKIIIYVDLTQYPLKANHENFLIIFDYLRSNLSANSKSFPTIFPHSFIISQFKGYRKPFEERPRQPININQSLDLPELIKLIHTSSY